MLNELLIAERGAREAGVQMAQRHPDIKDARRIPTLLVQLDEQGYVALLRPVSPDVTLWTLRDGQHNSFPFVQPKTPLLKVAPNDERLKLVNDKSSAKRHETLCSLCAEVPLSVEEYVNWPARSLLKSLRERRQQIASLEGSEAASLPAAIDRILLACDASNGGDPARLLTELVQRLANVLRETADDSWIEVASGLLAGKFNPKTSRWECVSALLFDAEGDWRSVADPKMIGPVSEAMRAVENLATDVPYRCCALTGEPGPLVESKFPQPKLPVLGQTFLFARNRDTPASGRYGRFSADSMPVALDTAVRLAAAIGALTINDREDVTWRSIPCESPKQRDLLLAYVEAAPEAPIAGTLAADDTEEDLSDEAPLPGLEQADSIAAFGTRAARVIDSIKAKVKANFTETPVRLAVLRKVDRANRKVVYAGEVPVKEYYRAAIAWRDGERNVPPWLTLLVLPKGQRKLRPMRPPHVAPLSLIGLSRQLFLRGGLDQQEVVGIPAAEAMGLFLEDDRPRVNRILRLVLQRRRPLVVGVAHAFRRSFDDAKDFNRFEALRTVTLLGILLHKLSKENYMNEAAFKLGQLLAAADVVHAGYCADVRNGDVPPSLLGNQVFAMAQSNPSKAIDALCRRWKPYKGWHEKALRAIDAKSGRRRDETMRDSKDRAEQQRGWDIARALSVARRVQPLAEALRPVLVERPTEAFRAELLLGYMAGLPTMQKKDESAKGEQ